MRISDWSSDVCSSDLPGFGDGVGQPGKIGLLFELSDAIRCMRLIALRARLLGGKRAVPILYFSQVLNGLVVQGFSAHYDRFRLFQASGELIGRDLVFIGRR